MKPPSSLARRWLLAAVLLRWIAAVGLLVGICIGGLALRDLSRPPLPEESALIGPSSPARSEAASREAMVAAIAARPIRNELTAKRTIKAPATIPAIVESPTIPAAPAVEVVATFVSGDEALAFVRSQNTKDLMAWTVGSREGIYNVTAVGDGWLTLQGAGVEHTLHVVRRGP